MFAYKCPQCNEKVKTKKELKIHWVLFCSKFYEARVRCGYCKSDFLTWTDLKVHWTLHCSQFCNCEACTEFYKILNVMDGFAETIYCVMFTKHNIDVNPCELIPQLKHFSQFGKRLTKQARFIPGFAKCSCV